MHFTKAFIAALAATATMVIAIPVANAEGELVLRAPHDDIKREPQRDGQQAYIKREPQRDGQQAYIKREPQRDGQQAYISGPHILLKYLKEKFNKITEREPQRDGQQAYIKREPQRDGQQAYIKRTPEDFAVIEKMAKA